MMHYISNTSLTHDTKIFKSQHVMACNGHVITCHYMSGKMLMPTP